MQPGNEVRKHAETASLEVLLVGADRRDPAHPASRIYQVSA